MQLDRDRDRIKNNTISATAFKAIAAPSKPGEPEENETHKGLRVSDKGFLNTAVIQSQITYIDGDAGVLRYRGYPIEQLAEHSTHLETAYLLIYGALPSDRQLRLFESEVMSHSFVHADAEHFFRSFRYASHIPYSFVSEVVNDALAGMTRTPWPFSRARSRTLARIIVRQTPRYKARFLLLYGL